MLEISSRGVGFDFREICQHAALCYHAVRALRFRRPRAVDLERRSHAVAAGRRQGHAADGGAVQVHPDPLAK
jgi:hypothetical protein